MIARVFQILISDMPVDDGRLSADVVRNIASLKATYPDAAYHRYDHEELVDFLTDSFPKDVVDAYLQLTSFAFRADLARYCLLYEYGGLYSDLSYMHLRPIVPDPQTDVIVFRDIPGHPVWATSNAIIYAKPKAPVFERAINRIVENYKSRYYGLSPLDVTGPFLFGRALADSDDWHTTVFGDSQLVSKEQTGRANIVKVMPGGEVIALRNKLRDCSIDEMIDGHVNDYFNIWRNRQVWGEEAPKKTILTRMSKKFGARKR